MTRTLTFMLLLSTMGISLLQAMQPAASPSSLIARYYAIKDALTESNVSKSASAALEFSQTIERLDQDENQAIWNTLPATTKSRLNEYAKTIATTKDLNQQRTALVLLSQEMISMTRQVKLTDKEIYILYCPMKKAYWLSDSKTIRNPYYGKVMLGCGSVSGTIVH